MRHPNSVRPTKQLSTSAQIQDHGGLWLCIKPLFCSKHKDSVPLFPSKRRHSVRKTPHHTHRPFWLIVWTCVWMLYRIFNICFETMLWKPQCWDAFWRDKEVKHGGNCRICVLATLTLSPFLEKKIDLFPHYTAALPVGFGMTIRSVYLTSVWLTALVLCLLLDLPQAQPRMLHKNNVKRPRLETCGSS